MNKNNIVDNLTIEDLNIITSKLNYEVFKTSFGYGLKVKRGVKNE